MDVRLEDDIRWVSDDTRVPNKLDDARGLSLDFVGPEEMKRETYPLRYNQSYYTSLAAKFVTRAPFSPLQSPPGERVSPRHLFRLLVQTAANHYHPSCCLTNESHISPLFIEALRCWLIPASPVPGALSSSLQPTDVRLRHPSCMKELERPLPDSSMVEWSYGQ